MSRSRLAVGACVASLSTVALVGVSSAATSTKYTASMTGAQEVPAVYSKATGTATITVTGKRLCYVIVSKNLSGVPQAGHIHSGKKGKAGPVFVALFAKPTPLKQHKVSGCVTVKASQLKAIAAKPSGFYVNVHTKKYPDGALRGQLKKR
jgi:Cu/Zn superoxide dismutase